MLIGILIVIILILCGIIYLQYTRIQDLIDYREYSDNYWEARYNTVCKAFQKKKREVYALQRKMREAGLEVR